MSFPLFLAMAQSPESGQGGGNPLIGLIPVVLIFAIFYFLIIRPQQKRQKKHQEMLGAIQKNDRVLTSGGIYGKVLNVKDDRLVVEIARDVKVEVAKHSVSGVVGKEEG